MGTWLGLADATVSPRLQYRHKVFSVSFLFLFFVLPAHRVSLYFICGIFFFPFSQVFLWSPKCHGAEGKAEARERQQHKGPGGRWQGQKGQNRRSDAEQEQKEEAGRLQAAGRPGEPATSEEKRLGESAREVAQQGCEQEEAHCRSGEANQLLQSVATYPRRCHRLPAKSSGRLSKIAHLDGIWNISDF